MPKYSLSIVGLDLSFTTDAEPQRVEAARKLVEERYNLLQAGGKTLGKEKLLAFVALGLADDMLLSNRRLDNIHDRVGELLHKID